MVMASNAAESNPSEQIGESKPAGENTIVQGIADGRRQPTRVQADLSGFIGRDVWMVGKYER